MKLPLNVEVTVCPLSKASKYFGLRSCCCRVRGGCGCCPAPARASCNRPSPCLVFWELLCCAVLCRNSQHSCYVVTSCPLLATRGEDVSNWKLNLITAAHSPTLTPATLHTQISTQLHSYTATKVATYLQCSANICLVKLSSQQPATNDWLTGSRRDCHAGARSLVSTNITITTFPVFATVSISTVNIVATHCDCQVRGDCAGEDKIITILSIRYIQRWRLKAAGLTGLV